VFKKIVILGLLVILILYGAAEIWVNNYAESAIARKLKEDHPEAEDVAARVSIPVVVSLLGSGKIRRVGATADHVEVARIPLVGKLVGGAAIHASTVNVELSGLKINRDELLEQKRLQVESIDHLELTAEITQEEASKVLGLVPGAQFEFLPDVARITIGRLTIGGDFRVEEATKLHFLPGSLSGLPDGLDPVLELVNLPFVKCTETVAVKVEAGKLRVMCSQDNPPIRG
jgi:hypothetical protein